MYMLLNILTLYALLSAFYMLEHSGTMAPFTLYRIAIVTLHRGMISVG